jgi:hypothetical protein
VIEPQFLRHAFSHRGATKIGRFLGCSRSKVRQALLESGIAQPGHAPFPLHPIPSNTTHSQPRNDSIPSPAVSPHVLAQPTNEVDTSSTSSMPSLADHSFPSLSNTPDPFQNPHAILSDAQLDEAITHLRVHFNRAGISMLKGMLDRLGHNISRQRITDSLLRLDPIGRVFERTRVQRRKYQVPGPNALWHHDGQHGMY